MELLVPYWVGLGGNVYLMELCSDKVVRLLHEEFHIT